VCGSPTLSDVPHRSLSERLSRLFREPSTLIEPPPLTRWQRIWRTGAAVGIGLLAWAGVAEAQWDEEPILLWIDAAIGVAMLVVMQFRRRWPLTVALIAAAVGVLSASSAGAASVISVSLGTRRRWVELVPFVAVSVAAGMLHYEVQPANSSGFLADLAFTIFATGVLVAIGMYIGARRDLLATLKERAERAERDQAMRVAQARTNERARIAREMHDVLAHRISLVAMHAGAMTYRTDLSPAETRRSAEVIQANAHRALSDLREVLGMLREDRAPGAPERPQPTLRDVPGLIDEAEAAGMNVRLTNDVGDLGPAPETVGRSAYRIIQESLTNARKHAPNTAVHVRLSGGPGAELSVEVRNPLRVGEAPGVRPPLPESGLGLIGLAERAALSGGRLEHGQTSTREFFVRAHLPWPEPVVAGGES
jgi:signal transduction histidine kinase